MATHNDGTLMERGLFCAYDGSRFEGRRSSVNLHFCNNAELRLWVTQGQTYAYGNTTTEAQGVSHFGHSLTLVPLGRTKDLHFFISSFSNYKPWDTQLTISSRCALGCGFSPRKKSVGRRRVCR